MGFVIRLGRFNRQLHVEKKSLIILERIKIDAESEDNCTPEGPGPPFYATLGPMWPRSAPESIFAGFQASCGGHFGHEIDEKLG